MFFKIAQKLARYLGFFCNNIFHQELSKIRSHWSRANADDLKMHLATIVIAMPNESNQISYLVLSTIFVEPQNQHSTTTIVSHHLGRGQHPIPSFEQSIGNSEHKSCQ